MKLILLLLAVFLIYGQEIPYGNIPVYHRQILEKIHTWTEIQLNRNPIMNEMPDKDIVSLNDH